MYAVTFDDFKRKLDRLPDFPFVAKPVETCIIHSPLWETWFESYMRPESDLHVTVEPDGNVYTFFRLVQKPSPGSDNE